MYFPVYLIYAPVLNILLFLRHWFIDGSRAIFHQAISFIRFLDTFFAIPITTRYLFTPLYQDYSLVGYILGPLVRICFLIIGLIIYGLILSLALFITFFWLSIPVLISINSLNILFTL